MALTDAIAKIFGGDILEGVKGLIEEFHTSPEQQAQAALAFATLEAHKEEIQAARDQALAELQSKAIVAEATSGDKFVSRARPTFLYLVYVVLAYSFIVQPLILTALAVIAVWTHQIKWNEVASVIKPLELPGALFELFGAGYLGYAGMRSGDKFTSAIHAVAAMPGDSQAHVKLPLGLGEIHVGNVTPIAAGKKAA